MMDSSSMANIDCYGYTLTISSVSHFGHFGGHRHKLIN